MTLPTREQLESVRRGSLIYFNPETVAWVLELGDALRDFDAWASSMPDAPGEMWTDDRRAWWDKKPPRSEVARLLGWSW